MISLRSLVAATAISCLALTAQARVVGIATNPQGSLGYSVGTAVARVMQQYAHIPTRVVPTSGSSAYTPMLNRGDVEFGILSTFDVVNGYDGLHYFKGHKNRNLRLVGVIFPIHVGLAVRNDSPVKAIKDLKGLRTGSRFPAQVTALFSQTAQLATGGVTPGMMRGVPIPDMFKGMRMLGEGQLDVAVACITCGLIKQVNVALRSHGGVRFLSLPDTPKAKAIMNKIFTGSYQKLFHPAPPFTGIRAPTRVLAESAFLVTNKDVPASLIYRTLKALHAHKAELAATSPAMRGFDPGFMAEKNAVPYDSGAVKFYKEIGQWPPRGH